MGFSKLLFNAALLEHQNTYRTKIKMLPTLSGNRQDVYKDKDVDGKRISL